MARYYSASGPIFGVACLGQAATSTPELPCHRIIFAGGGGSSKTGVGNAIFAVDLNETGLVELCKLDTGKELCSSVCVGRGNSVLVAIFGEAFRLCKLEGFGTNSPNEKRITVASGNYVADFNEIDPSINCCAIDIATDDLLATGGDDGVLRIWAFSDKKNEKLGCKIATTCGSGHASPITDCSFSESGHLVATASKDGTCKVWSIGTGAAICTLPAKDVMPSPMPCQHKKKCKTRNADKVIVRACKFVGDDGLISVQSASRGNAYAAKWIITPSDDDGTLLTIALAAKKCISKHPVSAMCLRDGLVAHGNVEGFIGFANARDLKSLGKTRAHELPVTALVFATASIADGIPSRALSVSADYKIVVTPSSHKGLASVIYLSILFALLTILFSSLVLLNA